MAADLTETSIKQFRAFIKFINDNDLWDEVEEKLAAEGITTVTVSSHHIRTVRSMIGGGSSPVMAGAVAASGGPAPLGGRLNRVGRAQANAILACGCGVATPGPGQQPQVPHGGGDAGAGDAGTLPQ